MSDNNKNYHHTANAPLIDCMNLQELMRTAFQDVSHKKFPARSYLFAFCGGGMTL